MIDGFLFIDKDRGLTSRKVCNQISFRLGEKKVGHVGTLDPFATGLLIVTLGKGNKAGQFLENAEKTYTATLQLGFETDTLDNTGNIVLKRTIPSLNEEQIVNCFNKFIGRQKQIPPMTSAIHVNGVKLYKLAHKGIEIKREPRDIFVKEINLISFKNNEIQFSCTVSTGTYIRVLASDIAKALGTVGHLTSLKRTKIGNISVEDAVKVDFSSEKDIINIFNVLNPISDLVVMDKEKAKDVMDGKIKIIKHIGQKDNLLVTDNTNNPIAMYVRINKREYEFKRGLF